MYTKVGSLAATGAVGGGLASTGFGASVTLVVTAAALLGAGFALLRIAPRRSGFRGMGARHRRP